ncbi:MAG: hypothetical protein AAB930_02635, partial [Patescibacteria group bacterium]
MIAENFLIGAIVVMVIFGALLTDAADINDLKNKLGEREEQIKTLQKEIAGFQSEVSKTQKDAATLDAEIKR